MSYFGEGLHMPRERTKQQEHMQWAVNYIYMSISFCCGCQKKIRHQHCKTFRRHISLLCLYFWASKVKTAHFYLIIKYRLKLYRPAC